jgi:hypothetical protein
MLKRLLLLALLASLLVLCAGSAGLVVWRRKRCTTHSASMGISAGDTALRVGDTLTLTVTLHNTGCVGLGLPQYQLTVDSERSGVLVPSRPEPVEHHLTVEPGQAHAGQFELQAVGAGEVTLSARASFEVHLGYPGPAYWASTSSRALRVTVEP